MFKIDYTAHKKTATISKIFCFLLFISLIGMLVFKDAKNYLNARTILSDYTAVDAELTFQGKFNKKDSIGREVDTYTFNYSFMVGEKKYNRDIKTNASYSDQYFKLKSVEVAYFNQVPSQFGRLTTLKKDSNLFTILGRLWMSFFGIGCLSIMVHYLVTKKLFLIQE